MADKKTVTIHYRKFARPAGIAQSLEDLVRSAMNAPVEDAATGVKIKDRYLARTQKILTDNLFVNIFQDGSGGGSLVYGDLLLFTKGHLQALCEMTDADASLVPVKQLKAPEQNEYIHSQMFWLVKDDHVFVIQSRSLKTAELEEYFEWLLSDRTSCLPAGSKVVLAAKFDASAVGGDLDDIQEIIVGGVVAHEAASSSQTPSQTTDTRREIESISQRNIGASTAAAFGKAKAILRELLDSDASVDRMLESVPEDAELNVQVHIGIKTKKKKYERVALKQLETGLRNLPDGQIEVRAKNKKIGKDGSVRLHHSAQIKLIKANVDESQFVSSLLDPFDVLAVMMQAYRSFHSQGKISDAEIRSEAT